MAFISYYFVLFLVCVCTFADDVFEENDLVFLREAGNNWTGYWMLVTRDGQRSPNPESIVVEILKPNTTAYNDVLNKLVSEEIEPKYEPRFIEGEVGDEFIPVWFPPQE
ncbi:uncharacterized protein LOC126847027 [Adelges cooleyi]|uniref:uncharacterized protein LOC126847027 n=1 Tax=Adelges cooleyi TaxID=133065 RepID=UPI0021809738|nr:uncharacterized protein LOC126847027 [Adelges cooleyi]XP_050442951.1 uncharacterized protein LOC126847027 [Adelges cooleyi]